MNGQLLNHNIMSFPISQEYLFHQNGLLKISPHITKDYVPNE